MEKAIYFDMDGTIADLYGVKNWYELGMSENPIIYAVARPMVDTKKVSRLLNELQDKGYRIGVVSWLWNNGSEKYSKEVRKAKKKWLKENFDVTFDEIHIVRYGTRKDYIALQKESFIFDDDIKVRKNWKGVAINPTEFSIEKVLEAILETA